MIPIPWDVVILMLPLAIVGIVILLLCAVINDGSGLRRLGP